MRKTRAIPENLHTALLAEAGTGKSCRELTAWLAETHGVKVGHVTVSRFLAQVRAERADVAKVVLRDKLANTLTADIDRLEKWAKHLDQDAEKLRTKAVKNWKDDGLDDYDDTRKVLVRFVEQLRRITETKLRYSGAAEEDDTQSSLAAAHERVKTKLDRLLS